MVGDGGGREGRRDGDNIVFSCLSLQIYFYRISKKT